MYTTKSTQKYVVFSDAPLSDVLSKINENKSRIVFVVTEHTVLLGSISDGDVRRWLLSCNLIDLNAPASEIMNANCRRVNINQGKEDYLALFKDGVDCVPLVDDAGHLVQLAFQRIEGIAIGDRVVSESTPVFIIAEIGNNHQGDIVLAKKLVDAAVDAGADCAKFQMRSMGQLYKNAGDSNDAAVDLGAQYTLDLLSKFQLSNTELFEVFDYCKARGILPLCTPWDKESLFALEAYGMPAYKVASADFTNFDLLEAIAKTEKPLICSTGMCHEKEILATVRFLDGLGANYILLHCNSTYPTPFKDVNLKYITRLRKISGKIVGYSGHERGISISIGAVALGARLLEKHITLDKMLEGTDHKVSLLPSELKELVTSVRNLEESLGSDEKARDITQGEMINRENLAKSLIANRPVPAGTQITREMISVMSPGQGLQPNRVSELVGKTARRDIEKGGYFFESDIEGSVEKRTHYKFRRPFGVPVRYHDYQKIIQDTNLDFVEFHLSYKDLEVELDDYFQGPQDIGFAVHSPELFAGDHILDLCSDDEKYRARSISELERVLDISRKLKTYFPKTITPVVVLNAGGWSNEGFIHHSKKPKKYQKIASALNNIDLTGVQVAIQTMPPFPWHFGGQSFHNLFVSADEIAAFCMENPTIKICLDVSHTTMACNYYGWNLDEFITRVAPYNVHMHIVDAKGVDGEGVEIGCGDVNFTELAHLLNKLNPSIQFIPEVWQGHKNGGEGFWKALAFLEDHL